VKGYNRLCIWLKTVKLKVKEKPMATTDELLDVADQGMEVCIAPV
jgi:hypothetical protein